MSSHQVTQLLENWQNGDAAALDALMPLVYDELRKIAHAHLRRQGQSPSLESRLVVHELYLKIPRLKNLRWQSRTHFLCVMSHLMRQVLVDQARARKAAKRDAIMLALNEEVAPKKSPDINLLALDDALKALEEMDAQQSRVVELRFFGGLSIEETAAALAISAATVRRDWATAKAWLLREIIR